MTTRRIRAVAGLTALTLLPTAALAQHELLMLPLGDPAYTQLEGLERVGCASARVSAYRPYTVGAVRRALRAARDQSRCAGPLYQALVARFGSDTAAVTREGFGLGGELEVRGTALSDAEFRPLWRDVRPREQGDPAAVGILRARASWNGGRRLYAAVEGYAQSDGRNDPLMRGRGVRQTDGVVDFSEAYLNGQAGPLLISFGRAREAWLGDGVESIALSANGPPIDRLLVGAGGRRWQARAFFGTINDVVLDAQRDGFSDSIPPQRVHRMVAGHALTFAPSPQFEISVGETALLSRRGGGVDLAYVNPLMVFLVSENDSARAGAAADENNLGVFAATRARVGGLGLAGELYIDDIQIDGKDRRNVPDQLAWRVEATYGTTLLYPGSVRLQYRRSDAYTYLRRPYSLVSGTYDQPLGSELGPDATLLRGDAEMWVGGAYRLSVGAGRWRRGAQRIDGRPSPSAVGHANEPFPSVTTDRPSVQEGWLADASIGRFHSQLPIRLRAELARLQNVNNQPAPPATYLRVSLVGSYRFRYP